MAVWTRVWRDAARRFSAMFAKSPRASRRAAKPPFFRSPLVDILEDRRLLSVVSGTNVQAPFQDFVQASVVADSRHLFLNNSDVATVGTANDKHNPALNSDDDNAVVSGKSALLPGTNVTNAANYLTSYTQGINGIMLDIDGLPSDNLSASDFDFKIGNQQFVR